MLMAVAAAIVLAAAFVMRMRVLSAVSMRVRMVVRMRMVVIATIILATAFFMRVRMGGAIGMLVRMVVLRGMIGMVCHTAVVAVVTGRHGAVAAMCAMHMMRHVNRPLVRATKQTACLMRQQVRDRHFCRMKIVSNVWECVCAHD